MLRQSTITVLAMLTGLAACRTPAPEPDITLREDDVVIVDETPVEAEPVVPAPEEPKPEPPEPKATQPQTHVAEPTVPEGLGFGEQALIRMAERVRGGLSFAPILPGSACGNSTGVQAYANAQGAANQVTDCPRVVAGVHALTYTRIFSKLGVLDASSVALLHDGNIIWSAVDTCEGLKIAENACPTDFRARRATALSFVGHELIYHVATQEAVGGESMTSRNEAFVVDVRSKLPAKPYSLLDGDSLLNQLKRNLELRRQVNPVELDAAKTLEDVWKLWRTEDFAQFGAYYYATWDAKAGLVDLRILYLESETDGPNELKELQVWVRPRPQWRSSFEEGANRTSGFLAE